ncbi:hypothetical protein NLG97_g11152 [Lecanicillium saksenae]|uniref:Uncharacterized protein n=1 Tax=Lecanicillium saksenae TaxID=468837 RepID=A0ACC1QCL2_9HYPO|nr:hypothetical protein NLG97_g11152 [Lecanicillium saksenae]
MVVKDVGVFPTWLCFPYKTRRILKLRVNLRIVRPDAKAVPLEWVELACYPENLRHPAAWVESPTFWNFYAVLALVPLSRLRYEPTRDENEAKAAAALKNGHFRQLPGGAAIGRQSASKITPASLQKHKSSVINAHLVSLEETPYVVDQLHLNFKWAECRPNGKLIIPGIPSEEDKSINGPFYREGYFQFGREVFHDDFDYSDSWDTYERQLEDQKAGRVSTELLLHHIWESISEITSYKEKEDDLVLYQYALANSVGAVIYCTTAGNEVTMMTKSTDSWVSEWESNGDWRTMNISKAIAAEEASEDPAQGYIALLKLAKRRRALGWQAQYDQEQKTRQDAKGQGSAGP